MIELRRLRYLVTLAMRLSYSRAAEELGISQSALTRAIQSLEKEMKLRLFDRDPAGVSLTEEGRRVVEKAEVLLTAAKDFEHQVTRTSSRTEGRIRFGMTPIAARTFLASTIPARLQAAPDFAHEVLVRDAEALWYLLTARQIEFFVSAEWPLPHVLPVRIEELGKFPINIIVRDGHPLLSGRPREARFPLLVSDPGSVAGQLPSEMLKHVASSINVFEDFGSLAEVTRTTDALWLTSAYALAPELAAGVLRELSWEGAAPARQISVSMYSLDRRSQSPAALELKHSFRQQVRTLGRARAGETRPATVGRL